MELIRAKYPDGRALLRCYQTDMPHGGLFIPTRKKLEVGSQLVVDPRFPELRTPVLLKSLLTWRRAGSRSANLRAGLCVELMASEHRKRDFLLGVARGEIIDLAHRRHRRLPVEIQVEWHEKSGRSTYVSTLDDVGEGGAFVRTTDFVPVGSGVILELTPPGGLRKLPIEGRVAWTRHTPGEEGIGVAFRCRDLGGARLLRELIHRIEERHEPPREATVAP
jgi:Tfp pilus assembly protein PilZ